MDFKKQIEDTGKEDLKKSACDATIFLDPNDGQRYICFFNEYGKFAFTEKDWETTRDKVDITLYQMKNGVYDKQLSEAKKSTNKTFVANRVNMCGGKGNK